MKALALSRCLLVALSCAALTVPMAHAECRDNIRSNVDVQRYSILAANEVLDTDTGLVWQRCPVGQVWQNDSCQQQAGQQSFTWNEALEYTEGLSGAWRLPNVKELNSLLKRSCFKPALERAVFSSAESGNHWSSTPAIGYFGNAWAVNLNSGSHTTVDKSNTYLIRLVRDFE